MEAEALLNIEDAGRNAFGVKRKGNTTPSVLGHIDVNAIHDSPSNTPAKGSLDCLAALTATPVRAIIEPNTSDPSAEFSPLKGWQGKRRRTAAAVTPIDPSAIPSGYFVFGQPLQMFGQPVQLQPPRTLFPNSIFSQQDQLQLPESNLMGAQTLGTYDASVGSPEALAASCKWRDLLIADVKGRLAALRRSKQRISKEKVKWSSDLAANTLMLDLERTLA
eukprot:CAMPEP_0197472842 /NCGR_PEP_ID=MMETSP1309-20131121/4131_1 /TAXON_ID=464262 /ORGANISM="Genus nov. species nov., Strain RCC998" /LENGTH=219 /DNA_ID=CAMNT_0043011647 /DNA_START=104 /DNA_END=760 /DNA_ORIENTATION=-